MKLNVKAFGLTLGIVWAVSAFGMGISAMTSGYGAKFVEVLGTVYIGYRATFPGSLAGAVWAFFDAGIGGVIIAWLYNKLVK